MRSGNENEDLAGIHPLLLSASLDKRDCFSLFIFWTGNVVTTEEFERRVQASQ
jgi:hypothetical protein